VSAAVDEALVEAAALEWFAELGYGVAHGLAPDVERQDAERRGYGDVVLVERLRAAIARLNPAIPAEARDQALRGVLRAEGPGLVAQNHRFHDMLADGVDVEYARPGGGIAGDKVWLADFQQPDRNDWLVANQVTVIEHGHERRPDILVYLNGLPVALIELKNPLDEKATMQGAFNQLQTYKSELPSLFPCNQVLVISDGREARAGTLTANWERFMPWKTIDGAGLAPSSMWELEVLIKGIFERGRFLDLIRHFIVFESDGATVNKKLAAYHQFHAVNKAVAATVEAAAPSGDKRAGVVWHTQGSGKSLTMAFFAGKIVRHPALANPTLVVLTDRNDLDDQLFESFAACQDVLHQAPVQAESREHLRELLRVGSGGIIFTTIQKFLPPDGTLQPALSQRLNIVFIADEAHRSQYGLSSHIVPGSQGEAPRLAYGMAKHMRDALPNASYIGFTGTPIELADKSTRGIFGDYIDTYDIQQAVEDGATVRIYYEARLAKLALAESERPVIDTEFEEITEGEEQQGREKLKTKWAQLEAMVGAEQRIALVARDLVEHVEARMAALEGKAMIVCMSRRICVALYDAIVALRPNWHDDDAERGTIKVVMTGAAADPPAFQPHIRSKAASKALAKRLKDPADSLKLVIVRDMWLTGFDAPCLHTMYADKPMKGHGLMQAIARVNRVFRDKPGGLVVDYLGLAEQLRRALADYTERDRDDTGVPQEQAVALMQEKYEIVRGLFHGFDYRVFFTGSAAQKLGVLPAAMEHVLQQQDGKKRLLKSVSELARAFALAVPAAEALAIREDVALFQAVRASTIKVTSSETEYKASMDSAINQLVSRVVVSDEVVDIFAAAGLKKPEISILSDAFLDEIRELPQRNLALELLQKLLNDEIAVRAKRNVVQARLFSEMLEASIRKYQNRSLEAAQVIAELVEMAKEIREAAKRGERMGLTDDELAFYDALGTNDSAVQALGDETLKATARDLVQSIRNTVTIDWTVKESVRARLRATVKRLLRKHGYPPDKQEEAVKTILEQTEVLAWDWAS
jgi:type I restriction enzyme, R subunit